MDVLFHETYKRLPSPTSRKCPRGFPYSHLLYADDTLLISRSAAQASLLLHTLQQTALDFGLHLNLSKTVHIPLNSFRKVTLMDGQAVPKESDTTYLGAKFGAFPDPGAELDNRLQSAFLTWRKLFLFWKYGEVPQRLKLSFTTPLLKPNSFMVWRLCHFRTHTKQN